MPSSLIKFEITEMITYAVAQMTPPLLLTRRPSTAVSVLMPEKAAHPTGTDVFVCMCMRDRGFNLVCFEEEVNKQLRDVQPVDELLLKHSVQ